MSGSAFSMKYCFGLKLSRSTNVGSFLFLIALAGSVYGQGAVKGSVANNPLGPFTESIERRSRETALRSLKPEPTERRTERIDPAVLEQLNEDFKQIQIVRLELVGDIKKGSPLERKRLLTDLDEINERSDRLRAFLAFSEAKESDTRIARAEADKMEIDQAIVRLCSEINRFVENPIFKTAGAYQALDALEAARTLDLMVGLSTDIKKRVKKSHGSKK
jgi:hypothetical protein